MNNIETLVTMILTRINQKHGTDYGFSEFRLYKPPDPAKHTKIGVTVTETRCIIDLIHIDPNIGKVFRCYLKPDIYGGIGEIRQDTIKDAGGYDATVFHVDVRVDPTFMRRFGTKYLCPDVVVVSGECILSMSDGVGGFTNITTLEGQTIRMPCSFGMSVLA